MSGEKIHTIRFGTRGWKVGDQAIHATGACSPKYKVHRRDEVTRVDKITLRILELTGGRFDTNIILNDEVLSSPAVCRLARNDGFFGSAPFFDYFLQSQKPGIHNAQLIQWKPDPIDYLNL